MSEECLIERTLETTSYPELGHPPIRQRGDSLIRRQSMPLLLPSIYEQQIFKRRVSLIKSSVGNNMFDNIGEINSDHRKRHSLDLQASSTSKDSLVNVDDVQFPVRKRSLSVDHKLLPGGKHTRERGHMRTNASEKIKKGLEEMEKEFSESTMKEIKRLRNLYQRGDSNADSDLSDDEL